MAAVATWNEANPRLASPGATPSPTGTGSKRMVVTSGLALGSQPSSERRAAALSELSLLRLRT